MTGYSAFCVFVSCAFILCGTLADRVKEQHDVSATTLQKSIRSKISPKDLNLAKYFTTTNEINSGDTNQKQISNVPIFKHGIDPSVLSDVLPEVSELDKHLANRILQPVSPFENSNLEMRLMENEENNGDHVRTHEYGSSGNLLIDDAVLKEGTYVVNGDEFLSSIDKNLEIHVLENGETDNRRIAILNEDLMENEISQVNNVDTNSNAGAKDNENINTDIDFITKGRNGNEFEATTESNIILSLSNQKLEITSNTGDPLIEVKKDYANFGTEGTTSTATTENTEYNFGDIISKSTNSNEEKYLNTEDEENISTFSSNSENLIVAEQINQEHSEQFGAKDEIILESIFSSPSTNELMEDFSNLRNIPNDTSTESDMEANLETQNAVALTNVSLTDISKAQAQLLVNNITVKDFYEDKFNITDSVESTETPSEVLHVESENQSDAEQSNLLGNSQDVDPLTISIDKNLDSTINPFSVESNEVLLENEPKTFNEEFIDQEILGVSSVDTTTYINKEIDIDHSEYTTNIVDTYITSTTPDHTSSLEKSLSIHDNNESIPTDLPNEEIVDIVVLGKEFYPTTDFPLVKSTTSVNFNEDSASISKDKYNLRTDDDDINFVEDFTERNNAATVVHDFDLRIPSTTTATGEHLDTYLKSVENNDDEESGEIYEENLENSHGNKKVDGRTVQVTADGISERTFHFRIPETSSIPEDNIQNYEDTSTESMKTTTQVETFLDDVRISGETSGIDFKFENESNIISDNELPSTIVGSKLLEDKDINIDKDQNMSSDLANSENDKIQMVYQEVQPTTIEDNYEILTTVEQFTELVNTNKLNAVSGIKVPSSNEANEDVDPLNRFATVFEHFTKTTTDGVSETDENAEPSSTEANVDVDSLNRFSNENLGHPHENERFEDLGVHVHVGDVDIDVNEDIDIFEDVFEPHGLRNVESNNSSTEATVEQQTVNDKLNVGVHETKEFVETTSIFTTDAFNKNIHSKISATDTEYVNNSFTESTLQNDLLKFNDDMNLNDSRRNIDELEMTTESFNSENESIIKDNSVIESTNLNVLLKLNDNDINLNDSTRNIDGTTTESFNSENESIIKDNSQFPTYFHDDFNNSTNIENDFYFPSDNLVQVSTDGTSEARENSRNSEEDSSDLNSSQNFVDTHSNNSEISSKNSVLETLDVNMNPDSSTTVKELYTPVSVTKDFEENVKTEESNPNTNFGSVSEDVAYNIYTSEASGTKVYESNLINQIIDKSSRAEDNSEDAKQNLEKADEETLEKYDAGKGTYVIHTADEETARSSEGNELDDLRSNVYTSLDDISQRMIWNSANQEYVPMTSREELEIVNITADTTFAYGDNIRSWKSLTTANKIYLIGIGPAEIIFMRMLPMENNKLQHEVLQKISLDNPKSFDLFQIRTKIKNTLDTILTVAVGKQIIWYQINSDDQLMVVWTLVLHSSLNFVKFVDLNGETSLLTLEKMENGRFSANIYGFSFEHKDFWIKQRLILECEADVAAFNFVADVVYLSIPQVKSNEVVVYKFSEGRFLPYESLQSTGVDFVSAFSVGHNNFLAVGGLDHALYRLDLHGIRPEAILDSTFDRVRFYLPVRVRDLRDDLVVLVQHEIDHETHSSLHVEALVWTERGFATSPHEPCDDHGDLRYGFQCLIDDETDSGLIGAAVIHHHAHSISIIAPRKSLYSELYDIHTHLVPIEDPRRAQLNHLQKLRQKLEEIIIHQFQIVEEAKKALDNSVNIHTNNLVKSKWSLKELETPVYRELTEDVQWTNGFLAISDIKFTKNDTKVHIPTLVEESDKILASVLDMPLILKDAVKKKDSQVKLTQDLTILGDFKVEGGFKVDSLCVTDINGEVTKDLFHKLIYDKHTINYNGDVKFDKVYVHNLVVDNINDTPASSLLTKSPEVIIDGNLQFVEGADFDKVFIKTDGSVNGIDFPNLQRTDVKLDTVFLEHVRVLEDFKVRNLNGFVIDEQELSDATTGRVERQIEGSELVKVLGDIAFDTINGLDWKEFVSRMVWKNAPKVLEKTMIIQGNIICPERCLIYMPNVNGLSFPSDFVLTGVSSTKSFENINDPKIGPEFIEVPNVDPANVQNVDHRYIEIRNAEDLTKPESEQLPNLDTRSVEHSAEAILITGSKTFDILTVGSLDCPGFVNGVPPEDVITLQGEQNIRGGVTFEKLKVTEGLHIGGSLTGKYLEKFTANPTLKDSNIISSNIIFRHLEVQGPIYIQSLNSTNLKDILDDVVYRNQEEEIFIRGYKQFQNTVTIVDNLELTSNRINGYDTVNILTTNTEQMLTVNYLQGEVSFHDLTLTGTVDGVNITDIDVNTVKLRGDQYVSADITFEEDPSFNKLDIYYVDGRSIEDFYNIDELIRIQTSVKFNELVVEDLNVDRLYIERDVVNHYNLEEIRDNCLSITRPQNISVDFSSNVLNTVNVTVKDYNVLPVQVNSRRRRNVTQILSFGSEEIEEFIIEGAVTTGKINGYDFKDVVNNAVWLNKENQISGNLDFMDGFSASEINAIGTVNSYNFNEFLEDLVLYKDNLKIYGHKTFTSGLVVENLLTNKINAIDVQNIMTKSTDQMFYGSFMVNGDVTMDKATCNGRFNGVNLEEIKERYTFEDGVHVLRGNAVFSKAISIKSLILDEFHGVNMHQFVPHIVSINDETSFSNKIVFQNHVEFAADLEIDQMYNEVKFKEFLENLVFIDKDSVLQGAMVFEKGVVFAGDLKIDGNIAATTVDGCDLEYWKENRINIKNGGFITGHKIFLKITNSTNNWNTRLLNGRHLSEVFTLNTDQVIPDPVHFSSLVVEQNLDLTGTINGRIFAEEAANTLMAIANHEQIIETTTTFTSIHVQNHLTTSALVNQKYNLQNPFTLDTDQTILTPGHIFESILTPYLETNGTASGVDFREWTANAVRKSGRDQIITGHWSLGKLDAQGNILGNNILNKRDMHDLADEVAKQKVLQELYARDLKDEYNSFCVDVKYLLDLSKKSLYLLKYFEEIQYIQTSSVKSVHAYDLNADKYVIVNYGGCQSTIYKWNFLIEKLEFLVSLETGAVDQWITVVSDAGVFLVSRSDYGVGCDLDNAGHVWYVEGDSLKRIFDFERVREVTDGEKNLFYTVDDFGVKEYKMKNLNDVVMSGSWNLYTDDSTFVPRATGFDLSLSDGKRLTKLTKTAEFESTADDAIFGSEPVISRAVSSTGVSTTECAYLPRRGAGEVVALTVGFGTSLRQLVAVSVLENATVRGNHDFIKIYDDVMEGRLFQTLSCHRPSSLVPMHFGQGQTILAFIEDNTNIQIFEYRGVEGFRPLYSFKFPATRLVTAALPVATSSSRRRHLIAAGAEGIRVLAALMHGDRVELQDELQCIKP